MIERLDRPYYNIYNTDSGDEDIQSHRHFSGREEYIDQLRSNEFADDVFGVDLTVRALGERAIRAAGGSKSLKKSAEMFGQILLNLPQFDIEEGMGLVEFGDVLANAIKMGAGKAAGGGGGNILVDAEDHVQRTVEEEDEVEEEEEVEEEDEVREDEMPSIAYEDAIFVSVGSFLIWHRTRVKRPPHLLRYTA